MKDEKRTLIKTECVVTVACIMPQILWTESKFKHEFKCDDIKSNAQTGATVSRHFL